MIWLCLSTFLIGAWILLPSLLLVFPVPSHWLKSRRMKPKQGLAISIPLSLTLPPKGGGDGFPGQWYESKNPQGDDKRAVLIVHGRSRSRGFMEPLALALVEDFSILTFDLRHHGNRGYGSVSYGLLESEDVHRALDYLKSRGISRIGIVGISMGGAAAAKALSERSYPEVLALALVGPVASAGQVVKQFAPGFGLPGPLHPVLMGLGGFFADADLRRADTALWLAGVSQPKALLTGDHDEVLGKTHSAILEKAIRFDLVQEYRGGHDEPGNPELQNLLKAWLKEKLSKSF